MTVKNIENLSEKAYKSLKKSIVRGDFYPGQKLVERDIANLLKISRTPVREAIQKLESECLVRKSSKGGVIITETSPREIQQLYAIRIELERLAVRWAVEQIKPHELKRLKQYVEKMELYGLKNEWEKSALYNTKFHEAIAKASDCSKLGILLGILKGNIHQAISRGLRTESAFETTIREHGEIIAAIERRDADLACAIMKKHLEHSCVNVLAQVR